MEPGELWIVKRSVGTARPSYLYNAFLTYAFSSEDHAKAYYRYMERGEPAPEPMERIIPISPGEPIFILSMHDWHRLGGPTSEVVKLLYRDQVLWSTTGSIKMNCDSI